MRRWFAPSITSTQLLGYLGWLNHPHLKTYGRWHVCTATNRGCTWSTVASNCWRDNPTSSTSVKSQPPTVVQPGPPHWGQEVKINMVVEEKDANLLVEIALILTMLLLSGRNKRISRKRFDHPLLRPSSPEPPNPGVEVLQWAGALPHSHIRQPVRAQHLHTALEPLCGAWRLQGPIWRRFSATDGPQELEAHGHLHLHVLHAVLHAHRTYWCHHWWSRWWVHKQRHKPAWKLVHWSNRSATETYQKMRLVLVFSYW